MAIAKLILSDLRHRKTRSVLTVSAVAIAVSLVVAMTGGLSSLKATAYDVLGSFYGEIDVAVQPEDPEGLMFGEELAKAIAADERVQAIRPQLTGQSMLLRKDGRPLNDRPAQLIGIRPESQAVLQRHPLKSGRWFTLEEQDKAVVDEAILKRLKIELGETISLPSPDGPRKLMVVGSVGKMAILNIEAPTVYMPLEAMRKILGREGQLNLIEIDLKPGADSVTFAADIKKLNTPNTPPLTVKTVATQKAKFDRQFEGLELLSYIGGTVSMVSAIFIIFSTLAMGVAERSRTLAMLRAIGALKSQIATLVIVEGLLLTGVGALVGVGLGWVWVWMLVNYQPRLFAQGVEINWGGAVYGVVGSLTAALLASLLPAYAATRVSALDAMTISAKQRSPLAPLLWAVVGAVLLALDPLLIFAPGIDRETRILLHLYIGMPCFMLGMFALAPLMVVLVDRVLGPVVSWLLWLPSGLLRQQLSGALGRAAGTAGALMVGLTVLVLIQIHGGAMIGAWQLPNRYPDMLIFTPLGLNEEQVKGFDTVKGIRPGRWVHVGLYSPKVGANIFSVAGLMQAPDATILFGADPERTFGTNNEQGFPLVELDYVEGDQPTALKLMGEGRNIVVSEEFKKLQGFKVGDKLELETPSKKKVEYTIVGVARSPGIDMLVRMMRVDKEFEQWTSAAALTSLENLKKDFGVKRFVLFAANVEGDDSNKQEMEARVQKQLDAWGLISSDARRIKQEVDSKLQLVLDICSSVAFMAILVASIGVTNTIMASVRSRRWQFGVLRSIGLTRGTLLRLVIAEAVLIALVASALGAGGGVLLSVNANGMAGHVIGVQPPLVIRSGPLWVGTLLTLGVAVLAALWPALRTARADTLRLLQSGRATA